MERWSCGTDGDSKSRRTSCRNTKELETGGNGNGGSSEEYEKTIWQEKVESSRTKGWRQYVARKQEYPIESTLKEVG